MEEIVETPAQLELEDLVNLVDYSAMAENYVPSMFALKFINFIKLVNGSEGEENETPLIHYYMLDQLLKGRDNLFVAFRGSAKTSLLHEYMLLYLATYGEIDGFGDVSVAMYVSDTMDNGVKSMRKNLEFRFNSSAFLKKYIVNAKFTDVEWEFENKDGHKFFCKGFGASTGVRGFKQYGKRPQWCGLDDLMSDKNAESPTIVSDIENIIYKGVRQALHPRKRMTLWTGTPFNKKDPLYKAAGSGAWNTTVYPICEKFPCTREEFVGAWEDRFPYSFVLAEYNRFLSLGKIDAFNQELMLKIISDEDRLVKMSNIVWYDRYKVLRNKDRYNFYITTDFATSEKQKSDYSVIIVWAYTNKGDWLLVDGMCKRQNMSENIKALFKFVAMYNPVKTGIEVTGQQKGFISWINDKMLERNLFFTLASDKKTGELGLRPAVSKLVRFNTVVPLFVSHKIWLPNQLKDDILIKELLDEVLNVTSAGYKSKHDDVGDTVAQILLLDAWLPSDYVENNDNDEEQDPYEDEEVEESSRMNSYIP